MENQAFNFVATAAEAAKDQARAVELLLIRLDNLYHRQAHTAAAAAKLAAAEKELISAETDVYWQGMDNCSELTAYRNTVKYCKIILKAAQEAEAEAEALLRQAQDASAEAAKVARISTATAIRSIQHLLTLKNK